MCIRDRDPLAGEGEDILLHTFDDLRSGKQGLPGKPHDAGFIVGPAVFAKQLQRLSDRNPAAENQLYKRYATHQGRAAGGDDAQGT